MKYLNILFLISLPLDTFAKEPCKKITQALLELYPEHTKSIMVTRFENASNKHKFLRSFIPYYYKQVAKNADAIPAFKKARRTQGHIAGDAHVENFGFLTDNTGKGVMGLNDFDDVGESSLILDVMRLSQSASYMDKEMDHAKLLKAYVKGLNGESYEMSAYIKKLAQKSDDGGFTTKADFTVTDAGKKFNVKQAPTFATTPAQNKEIEQILKQKYGSDVVLHDTYRTMKESGGSAWGTRYHLLAEIKGEIHFIELKEAAGTGIVPELLSKTTGNKDRILGARDVFLGKNFDEKLDVISLENQTYQLRYKAAGNKSIDFGKVKSKERGQVIQDEFFILGQLHRKSLGADAKKIATYNKDLNSISAKDWQETLKFMRAKIKKAFDAANP